MSLHPPSKESLSFKQDSLNKHIYDMVVKDLGRALGAWTRLAVLPPWQ